MKGEPESRRGGECTLGWQDMEEDPGEAGSEDSGVGGTGRTGDILCTRWVGVGPECSEQAGLAD